MHHDVWTCDACKVELPSRPEVFFAIVEQTPKGTHSQTNVHMCQACFDQTARGTPALLAAAVTSDGRPLRVCPGPPTNAPRVRAINH